MKICSRPGQFESLRVYHGARSGGIIGISFRFFFNMKVYCVFSLESPQGGDSNKYTQYTISQYKKENHLTLSKPAIMGFVPRDSRMSSKQPW